MATSTPSGDEIATLAETIHKIVEITPFSQVRERIQILETWFGSVDTSRRALSNSLVLELGCGQGDMTVTLAGMGARDLRILAVDPGALDYGAPLTLGQAQEHISKTSLGQGIEWIQAESMEFIAQLKQQGKVPDFVLLAHSLFYLPSETYLLELLIALKDLSTSAGKPMKLLLAEWGMRASHSAAEAHVLAVKAQAKMKIPDGNIRTLFTPEILRRIAGEAGWILQREAFFVPEEDVDDGAWEVATARVIEKKGWRDEGKEVEEMEKAAQVEKVRCMDVWAGVLE